MIPRDKPKELWDVEWVAMHTDFHFPEVTDAGFLAEFKKLMIEVAGDRLYDYQAAEQVEACLILGRHSCPTMEKEAEVEGFTRCKKIKDFIVLQVDVLCDAAEKWRASSDLGKHTKMDFSDLLAQELRVNADAYQKANPDYDPNYKGPVG